MENIYLLSGILIIDKPAGWTSHDVVAKLRGVLKIKRIGHGGTLDPMATGVLPVFVGRATRAAEFCENADKEYIAGLRLGVVTDTQDITGNIQSENEVTVTLDDVKAILPLFTGKQEQIPPMYSAVKKDGWKLYELARLGKDIPRKPRDITVFSMEVLEVPEIQDPETPNTYILRIKCSKGTYIRTLCHDIGAALGCGGTLASLQRIRAGDYSIEMAHSLDDVISMVLSDSVNNIILPVDSIFSGYPSIYISRTEERKAKNGAVCQTGKDTGDGTYRVYGQSGEFLLLGDVSGNKIKTIKSFFDIGG